HWVRLVAVERFPKEVAPLLTGGCSGLAAALLAGEDRAGWFAAGRREAAIHEAMTATLERLTERLGPDFTQWTWGRGHVLPFRHYLSGRGDLDQLLDHGGAPVQGNAHTVCNTGLGSQYEARAGAGYRLIADLSTSPPGLWAVDGQSQSGHPGSAHYADQ